MILFLLLVSRANASLPSCPTHTSVPETPPPSGPNLIIFVSFSLGDATLKKLHNDARHVGGRLVMRGLHKNSFRATQAKIQKLGITVDIDPPLFDTFHVTRVPTFIRARSHEKSIHDRLEGNVTLAYALDLFHREGSLREVKGPLYAARPPL